MFYTPRGTLVAQMSVARGPRTMLMLTDKIGYVTMSQHTELSGVVRPIQTCKLISSELWIMRVLIEDFHPCVIIGSNLR